MIYIDNIWKSFGPLPVLQGVTTQINKGEAVALIGPSGSGKSTLLRCINGLDVPSQGQITLDQTPVTPATAPQIRRSVGMVFQNFNLFPHFTVLENLTFAPMQVLKKDLKSAQATARELLQQVGLVDKATAYPDHLSGGQKQRAAIARALAMQPSVILFDEPTSALDPEMVKEVLMVIKSLTHTGITMVIVTHEMGFARDAADRILFLDQGQIVEDAPPTTFFRSPRSPRAQQFLDKVL